MKASSSIALVLLSTLGPAQAAGNLASFVRTTVSLSPVFPTAITTPLTPVGPP